MGLGAIAVPSCGGAVTECRHLSTIVVTPPPAPQSFTEIAAAPSCVEPLDRSRDVHRRPGGVSGGTRLAMPSHQRAPLAPPDGPPLYGAHGTIGQPSGRGGHHDSTGTV